MTSRESKGPDDPSPRRRWLSVILATVFMVVSYVVFIYALAAASGGETVYSGALLGMALGLVPGVFLVASWVSQNERTVSSTLWACALWLIVAFPISLGNVPAGLVAGYGAGGVMAFRLGPKHTRGSRVVAVMLTVVYTTALQTLWPEVGLFAGAPLPFLAVTVADLYKERFAEEPAA